MRHTSSIERELLSISVLLADCHVPQIAKKLRTSVARIRYAIDSLTERKILQVAPLIDRSRLGLVDYHVYFSLAARTEGHRKNFAECLGKARGLVFLAEVGGDFQYEAIISCRTALGACLLLDDIGTQCEVEIRARSVASNMAMRIFGKRYLGKRPHTDGEMYLDFLEPGSQTDTVAIDETDTRILQLLSNNGRASLRDIGATLGLSHSGIQHRIERLKKMKVLRGMYYDVEPLRYGYQDFIWQLSVPRKRRELEKKLFSVAANHPSVSYVASYFGEWDFELGLEVSEARLINAVIQELSEQLGADFVTRRLLMRFDEKALKPFPF